jgi:hypothetical protein
LTGTRKKFSFVLSGAGLLTLLSGCLITPPIPLKTATQTAAGQSLSLPNFKPVLGQTTRAELEQQYRGFAVYSEVPQVFLANYRISKWAMVAGIYGMGGPTDGRLWSTRTLVAEFDVQGRLSTFNDLEGSALFPRLQQIVGSGVMPPLDISQPIILPGPIGPANPAISIGTSQSLELVMSATSLIIRVPEHGEMVYEMRKGPVVLARANILSVAGGSGLRLLLAHKSPLGKQILVHLSAGQELTFLRWYRQTASPSS